MATDTGLKVSFTPSKFESAIARHGQYVRWYSTLPCYCIDDIAARPNPNCRECFGRGHIYTPVCDRQVVIDTVSCGGATIEVPTKIKSVTSITTKNGTEAVAVLSFSGTTITATSLLNKGSYYHVEYVEDLENTYTGTAHYLGKNIISVDIPETETVQGQFLGLITEVVTLRNVTRSTNVVVESIWENRIYTLSYAEPTDEFTVTCKYLDPIKLLIVAVHGEEQQRQGGSQSSKILAAFQDCDAVCTFPGHMVIGEGDLLTLLRAEQKTSIVAQLQTSEGTYKTPFFHLRRVIYAKDQIGVLTDVTIVRQSEFKFLGRQPVGKVAISFMYAPTFVVAKTPNLRYGEDKVFPKRIGLKRWEASQRVEIRPGVASLSALSLGGSGVGDTI